MSRPDGWGAKAAEAFTFMGTPANPEVPQNSVCFLFAPVLFCPQRFQQAIVLHSRSRGSGVRQRERLIKSGHSVQADLRPVKLEELRIHEVNYMVLFSNFYCTDG